MWTIYFFIQFCLIYQTELDEESEKNNRFAPRELSFYQIWLRIYES
jgi:hypothetical protein